jgi:hypothetical protein
VFDVFEDGEEVNDDDVGRGRKEREEEKEKEKKSERFREWSDDEEETEMTPEEEQVWVLEFNSFGRGSSCAKMQGLIVWLN